MDKSEPDATPKPPEIVRRAGHSAMLQRMSWALVGRQVCLVRLRFLKSFTSNKLKGHRSVSYGYDF